MKSWEPIADNLSKAGWNWGCVSAIDSNGRTIWIADALTANPESSAQNQPISGISGEAVQEN